MDQNASKKSINQNVFDELSTYQISEITRFKYE